MKTNIPERIAALREAMKQHKIDAYIIPTSDPHMSEYPADCWKYREWISGFTGSAGTVIITADKAGLWTDSRYFLQASTQLEGTGIELFKMMLPETPTIPEFLTHELKEGQTVGLNGETYSLADARSLEKALAEKEIKLNTNASLIDPIWKERPAIPEAPMFEMPIELSGKSTEDKLIDINKMLHKAGADCTILSALDEVAWTFNIRGTDVAYNPVVISYAFVSEKESVLFVNPKKIPAEIAEHLKKEGVTLADYGMLATFLSRLPERTRVFIDSKRTNVAIYNALPKSSILIEGTSPANHLKSIKNETEIKGFRNAVLKDGIAMTKFYFWLEKMLKAGEKVTELSAAAKLTALRSEQPQYVMDSFASISSYGPHGAVVHYSPTPETDTELKTDSLYLLDSGAQYLDGTTDITRTIALCDEPSEQMKKDFTRALKGTIGIAKCKFPAGIRGCLIDAFARKALWDAGINYLHGTCHGIGHCLNVHEGPQSIRMEENPVILEPGMVMSDEPAIYRPGEYGIRTENMILIHEDSETEFGKFLGFETLTLCYIDTKLVIPSMLSVREHAWLNKYHQMVYDLVSPHLTEEEKAWLKEKNGRNLINRRLTIDNRFVVLS
ncbi:MAG: aminopeptidase P family protein [Parabacteroides merdae]